MGPIPLTRDQFEDAITYNRKQNGTLWEPHELPWPFSVHAERGSAAMEADLVYLVLVYQAENDGLDADGKLGPATYRRLKTEADWARGYSEPLPSVVPQGTKSILFNGRRIPIHWNRVILMDDPGGFRCEPGSYTQVKPDSDRDVRLLVTHWDATLSTSRMASIIRKRNLSIHFGIDNDGTIYQLLDMQQQAWQCGHSYGNKYGVGVEISTAYYPKYQDWYEEQGFGSRPLMEGVRVHGRRLSPFLGFYPVQLDALEALMRALHKGLGIPLDTAYDDRGRMIQGVFDGAEGFSGFLHHFHLLRGKIDCAGLDLGGMIARAKLSIVVDGP